MSDFPIDLGHGVTMQWATKDGGRVGLLERHSTPDGEECTGYVALDVPGVREWRPDGPLWRVESWEPLTISPSVLCRQCGNHGFIRNGQWVPA